MADDAKPWGCSVKAAPAPTVKLKCFHQAQVDSGAKNGTANHTSSVANSWFFASLTLQETMDHQVLEMLENIHIEFLAMDNFIFMQNI